MSQPSRRRIRRAWGIAGLTLLVMVGIVAGLHTWRMRTAFVGGVGDRIVLDDFGFKLLAVRPVPVPDAEQVLLLEIEVQNLARRVDFTFNPDIARLHGPDGAEYRPVPRGDPLWARVGVPERGAHLAAGDRQEVPLLFRVPVGARGLQLRMSFAAEAGVPSLMTWAFDVMDTILFGEQRLALDGP